MSALKLYLSRGQAPQTTISFAGKLAAMAILLGGLCAALTGVSVAQTNITEFAIVRVAPVLPGITYGPDGGRIGSPNLPNLTAASSDALTRSQQCPHGNRPHQRSKLRALRNRLYGWLSMVHRTHRQPDRAPFHQPHLCGIPVHQRKQWPVQHDRRSRRQRWFVEFTQNKIAAFDPQNPAARPIPTARSNSPMNTALSAAAPRFGSPGTNAEINGLTTGPDNKIWFTQVSYGAIGRLSTNGDYALFYPSPTATANRDSSPAVLMERFGLLNTMSVKLAASRPTARKSTNIPSQLSPAIPCRNPTTSLRGRTGIFGLRNIKAAPSVASPRTALSPCSPRPQPSLPTMLATEYLGETVISGSVIRQSGQSFQDDAVLVVDRERILKFVCRKPGQPQCHLQRCRWCVSKLIR